MNISPIAMIAASLLLPAFAYAQQPQPITETSGAVQSEPPELPFLGGFLKETRILYPLQLGKWHAEGEHIYEQQDAGVSITYRDPSHADRLITVYFYPAGVIEDDMLKQAVDGSIADIKSNIGIPGGYADIQMDEPDLFTYQSKTGDGKASDKQGWSVGMRIIRDGRDLHSALALLHDRLYFVKGRLTLGEEALSIRETSQLLKSFMPDLLGKTTLTSTGGCWMPIPIVRKDAPLPAKNPEALFNIDQKGAGVDAVAYKDRIEALEVDSAQAKVMQLLAMSMTGRLFSGCEPPSDLLPSVPDGMREIRIEYRMPQSTEPDPSRQLRPARSGLG